MKTSRAKVQIFNTNNKLSKKLNDLLANYQIFYQNLRGLHWNIKGTKFFELHAKFEEFYNDALLKIDEIAERILTIGSSPFHTFSDFLKHSEIKEAKQINDASESIDLIIKNLEILLKKERELLHLSDKLNDEGTNSLMSDYIKEQEKTLWMLRAFIS